MTTVNKQPDAGKQRKGDTSRTSNQGQKLSSGGSKQTDNKSRPTSDVIQPGDGKTIKGTGRKM
jgi:hypothetical protein